MSCQHYVRAATSERLRRSEFVACKSTFSSFRENYYTFVITSQQNKIYVKFTIFEMPSKFGVFLSICLRRSIEINTSI